jgi:hypothetical protein
MDIAVSSAPEVLTANQGVQVLPKPIEQEGSDSFDSILVQELEKSILPENLVQLQEDIESGAKKSRFELMEMSTSFFSFAAENIDENGNSMSYDAVGFSMTAMFGMVEEYASTDAINDIGGIFSLLDGMDMMYMQLQNKIEELMATISLALDNGEKVDENGESIEAEEEDVVKAGEIKERMQELANSMLDPIKAADIQSLIT